MSSSTVYAPPVTTAPASRGTDIEVLLEGVEDVEVLDAGGGDDGPALPLPRRLARTVALGVLIAGIAVLAVQFHRTGHPQGDDFALYLRQARAVFAGNTAEIVADNRFTVANSEPLFSPDSYPWGFPLLLSPFVRLWGLDYERLKLVEVAVLCLSLVLIHGVVRRRTNAVVAWFVVATLGLSSAYLAHTGNLLSEFPHLLAVVTTIWFLDRTLDGATWLDATRWRLAVLGLLAAVTFNVRREGLVLVGVFAVAQAFDLADRWRARGRLGLPRRPLVWRSEWITLVTPYATFAAAVGAFQLLLPTTLMPDNDNRFGNVPTRTTRAIDVIANQLGFGPHTAWGVVLVAAAALGAVVGLVRSPRLHVPLVALAAGTGLVVGTHVRMVDRYYLQITPWVLTYATYAVIVVSGLAVRRVRRGALVGVVGTSVACAGLVALVPSAASRLTDDIDKIQDANARGLAQIGPTDRTSQSIFAAVERETGAGDVVGYFRARTLTLYTDRRAIQTTSLPRMAEVADYVALKRGSTFWQPELEPGDVARYDMSIAWQDANWILYRFGDA
ncbi:MAG: hypothetical protein M3Q72_07860 [Actinomycetota bacterium]|nr:hypothetical protein [Actinomycetota bacterium]